MNLQPILSSKLGIEEDRALDQELHTLIAGIRAQQWRLYE